MKKLIYLLAVLLAAPLAYADNMGDDFHDHYVKGKSNLKAYNQDLNGLVGMVDFHTGRGGYFPAVNLGANVSVFKPSHDNNISSDSYTVLPFLIAETKIPVLDLGVVARGTSVNGYRSIGGGLTYRMNVVEVINLSFGAFYDNGRTDWYRNDHYSASAIASVDVLFFTPYVGVGYDYGKIKTHGYADNESASSGTPRGMVGINLHPFPLLTGFVAYTVTKDSHGFTGGLGLSF
ncbi:MAG: hypothetical protein J6Y25_00275 [Elusimicrobiaceae bacterium]|nr:hypothetical protein [Elusimicrobiaceae bacterium]MBP5617121.1 hypothetical protein [Elusimicrobiaceae bacterium]